MGRTRRHSIILSCLTLITTIYFLPAILGPTGFAHAGTTERVSLSSTNVEGNNVSDARPSVSSDGRYVAFRSLATNLVAGDTNGVYDIFVRDRVTGQTTRVSVDSAGVQSNGQSPSSFISWNGRCVAFESDASNLVAGDTNAASDIFLHDLNTAQTTRVSVDSAGLQSNGQSLAPSTSSDGRYVVFQSLATNLVAGDTNGVADIFLHDRTSGQTIRVSVSSAGAQGNGQSQGPSVSTDGRIIAFESSASNLVAGDTNGVADIFVRDRVLGQTRRVSVDSLGVQGNNASGNASISPDGRFIAFTSSASNLVAGDTNGVADIFVHDSNTGDTVRVSLDSSGVQGNLASDNPSISNNGRYIAFESAATNLTAGDTNGVGDVFVHDLVTDRTVRVSVDSTGVEGNLQSSRAFISSEGIYTVFASLATNLAAGDTNGASDIFLNDLTGVFPVSVSGGAAASGGGGCFIDASKN